MLDNQVIDAWTGVQEDVLALENAYERIFKRQEERDAKANPFAIPADEPSAPEHHVRASLLSGLAAVIITVALFVSGIAAVVAPAPALAVPAHMILY